MTSVADLGRHGRHSRTGRGSAESERLCDIVSSGLTPFHTCDVMVPPFLMSSCSCLRNKPIWLRLAVSRWSR